MVSSGGEEIGYAVMSPAKARRCYTAIDSQTRTTEVQVMTTKYTIELSSSSFTTTP